MTTTGLTICNPRSLEIDSVYDIYCGASGVTGVCVSATLITGAKGGTTAVIRYAGAAS